MQTTIIRMFFFTMIIFLIQTGGLFAEGPNILIRTGAEYFNWSYRGNPSIRSNAIIEADPYQLVSYSLDLYLKGSAFLSVDYYQPINAEKEGSFYVNDLKKISFSPFMFLMEGRESYLARVFLSGEYIRDYREFTTRVSTKSKLTYYPLKGDPVALDGESPGIEFMSRFKRTDISFDLLGGYLKLASPFEGGGDNPVNRFIRNIEFRLGYIESKSLQPMGNSIMFDDGSFLDEARVESKGFIYGFKTKDRGAPGLNLSFYYSYGEGDIESHNKSYRVEQNYNFGEIWYNWTRTYHKMDLMFTLGYFAEWVEILKGETQIRRDTMRTTYFKTGVCF